MQDNSSGDYNPIIFEVILLIKRLQRFPFGNVAITANAMSLLHPSDALMGLARHSQMDWGDVAEEDRGLNDQALIDGTRLLSVYKDRNGETFWIITEADRSLTTILMPEDY